MKFKQWLFKVGELDKRFKFLQDKKYKDERNNFYEYYLARMTPSQALQKEFNEYGN